MLVARFLVLNVVGFLTGNTSAQRAFIKITARKQKPTVGAVIRAKGIWVFEVDFHDGLGGELLCVLSPF